jgi:hypothetical protein
MANLLGADIGTNYKGVLSLDSTINTPLDATLRAVTDGDGNASPLELSTTAVSVGTISGARLGIKGTGATSATTALLVQNSAGQTLLKANDNRDLYLGSSNSNYIHQGTFFQGNYYGSGNWMFGTLSDLGARLGIKGSGTTSATTALLVQNSAGTDAFKVRDDGTIFMGIGTASALICDAGGPDKIRTSSVGVGIEGSPVTSAALAVNGTSKGFLPPRMTTTQKNAISSPAAGLVVYDTTLSKLCVYTTAWETITSV